MIFNRKPILFLILILLSVCLLQSCFPKGKLLGVFNRTSVKNVPKDSTPFVFDNKITIENGVVAKDEQNRLESELNSYWDDTVKARTIQQWGFFYRIKNPQRFDTLGLYTSQRFMNAYLQSQGYYNAVFNADSSLTIFNKNSELAASVTGAIVGGGLGALIKPKTALRTGSITGGIGALAGLGVGTLIDKKARPEYRVTTIMNINPGKRLHFDSIAFNFIDTANAPTDSALQKLAAQVMGKTYLKKNDPYSKQVVAAELDRLVAHFRNNGYYRLQRNSLAAFLDTTDQLIDTLIIDPFELARKTAEAAERRRQRPTADVTLMQATQAKDIPFDSTVVTRYYIGKIFYYPETDATTDIPDTLLAKNHFKVRGGGIDSNRRRNTNASNIYMKYNKEPSQFRMRPLIRNTYMEKGELYSDKLFYRTVNTIGQIGAWQQVEWRDSIRNDTVDFHIFLSPAKKKNIKYDLELTRSTADFIASSNLFGLAGNVTFLNRNFRRRAIQWASFVRGGVELNPKTEGQFVQTFQFGAGTSFIYPHLWRPFTKREKTFDAGRTVININGNYTERADFFRVRSFTANLAWEFRKNTVGWSIRPNVELYSLDVLEGLQDQFIQNPFLKTAFNTGSVAGFILTYNITRPSLKKENLNHFFRWGFEYSGIPGVDALYNYAKGEIEFSRKRQFPKHETVYRLLLAGGYSFNNKTLPFFKQFVAGGPNSMRAWGLRQLGLGSSLLSDTADGFTDRFGDIQLEANFEYRFQLADIGGVKFNSALFVDVGNIWNAKKDAANPLGHIRLSQIPNDLAVAAGIGLLRMNVANFVIRVDFALKVKDPARREAEWLFKKFTWRNDNGNNNYAFQIGIGLPF